MCSFLQFVRQINADNRFAAAHGRKARDARHRLCACPAPRRADALELQPVQHGLPRRCCKRDDAQLFSLHFRGFTRKQRGAPPAEQLIRRAAAQEEDRRAGQGLGQQIAGIDIRLGLHASAFKGQRDHHGVRLPLQRAPPYDRINAHQPRAGRKPQNYGAHHGRDRQRAACARRLAHAQRQGVDDARGDECGHIKCDQPFPEMLLAAHPKREHAHCEADRQLDRQGYREAAHPVNRSRVDAAQHGGHRAPSPADAAAAEPAGKNKDQEIDREVVR